ncbi:uncharacterized protein LOC116195888 [Punica granatum]|uniref:C2 NT-type domain-containing protein n=2 Tax=Punica granatum TaxID=22663 RepID=A0A218X3F2_PUNGR|nr:uncharacterized protein LOC116195888 [Punica granatum]OWM79021.1 hypothetical protein CDL15_Pgr003192 [Punica granatum]PKI42959.1 hypothetical protein CRG98_036757 [Punica granatum]
MVVKMMRWRPWPPPATKKYEVRLVVRTLQGCDPLPEGAGEDRKLTAEIRWRGPKLALMSSLRRAPVKRNFTTEEVLAQNGAVVWEEEFQTVCGLTAYKENVFHPWEIGFTVFNVSSQGSKNKVPIIGSSSINLAEFASVAEQKDFELSIPLVSPTTPPAESPPMLSICLSLVELQTVAETSDSVQRQIVPITSPPQSGEAAPSEKHELSALKASLQKVKIIREYVSNRKAKKACHEEEGSEERCSGQSEDDDLSCPIESESLDDSEEGDSSDEGKEGPSARKSFSYGPLAHANHVGGSFYSGANIVGEYEDCVYYSNRRSDVASMPVEDVSALVSEEPQLQTSKRRILSWRKRKLSFRSPKTKGEPLLKKAYAEEGGDDIDFDRRQLSSDESPSHKPPKVDEDTSATHSSFSDFGDDNFAIGSWEQKEIISRDGHMKLQAQVFFASIDQRSERAAGEGACTALVAVIADWFQKNHKLMPIKSQFDSLIRDGSSEWRNLCENERYREQFPDKHFDLETVLEAHIRPLSVVPGKSFIGFFHPEDGAREEGRFDFLEGSLSFDNIWDEISRVGLEYSSSGDPQVYIVSWNDHFFVLKVEPEAYYIIDTLGERLHEGCDQAYILKFDSSTSISSLPPEDEKCDDDRTTPVAKNLQSEQGDLKEQCPETDGADSKKIVKSAEAEIICKGKESCKEYIKNFLAAIPIRELQADIQKGLIGSTPLHQRLQIEFHYTQFSQPPVIAPAAQATPRGPTTI